MHHHSKIFHSLFMGLYNSMTDFHGIKINSILMDESWEFHGKSDLSPTNYSPKLCMPVSYE